MFVYVVCSICKLFNYEGIKDNNNISVFKAILYIDKVLLHCYVSEMYFFIVYSILPVKSYLWTIKKQCA